MAIFASGEPSAFPRSQACIYDLIAERVRGALEVDGLREYEMFGRISGEKDEVERQKQAVKPLASNVARARITSNNPYLVPAGRVGDMAQALAMSADAVLWGDSDEVEGYAYALFRAIALDVMDGSASDGARLAVDDRLNEWAEYAVLDALFEAADSEWFDDELTSGNFLLPPSESVRDAMVEEAERAIARTFLSVSSEFPAAWSRFVAGKTTSKLHRLLSSFVEDELVPMLERTREDTGIGRMSRSIAATMLENMPSEVEYICGSSNEIPAETVGSGEPVADVMGELSALSINYLDAIAAVQVRLEGDPLERLGRP